MCLFKWILFVRIQLLFFVVCLLSIWLFVIAQVYHLNHVLLLHHVFIHLKTKVSTILRAVLFQVDFVISQVNNLCNIIITQFTYKSPLPLSDEHWWCGDCKPPHRELQIQSHTSCSWNTSPEKNRRLLNTHMIFKVRFNS